MRRLTLSWGRLDPACCPQCWSTLRSATGISDRPIGPAAGAATLCVNCGTWLIFEQRVFPSPKLTLRLATADEVTLLHPGRRALIERLAADLATAGPKQ